MSKIVLTILLIIVLVLIFAILYAILRVINLVGSHNIRTFADIIREARTGKFINNSPRSISGMTKIYEPQILKDFPDFNKELLYSKVESNMMQIYNSYEKQILSDTYDLQLMKEFLEEKLSDIKEKNISVSYNDIVFHRHAISEYERNNGIATIKISTALEYYYKENGTNTTKDKLDVKTQARIETTFVFVYDAHKITTTQPIYIMRCPNCGAPLKYLKNMSCEYCKAPINEINLKTWLMSSYKEE